ncbi:MAG: DUF3368 domain-containing protein [Brasilonema sp.]
MLITKRIGSGSDLRFAQQRLRSAPLGASYRPPEIGDVFIILDDRNARRIAQQLGLKVIGTVEMLLHAKQKGVIANVKPLLAALAQADFPIAEPLVQNTLRLAGEL